MKFSCDNKQLSEIVNTVQKAVTAKSVMPILECINIEVNLNGNITVTANNLDLCIEYYSSCSVEEPGSIAISSRMFGDIVRRLPDGVVNIDVNSSNNVMTIVCGKSEFNIQGMNSQEYPTVPEVEENYKFTLSQSLLKKMIRKTVFAVSNNEVRKPILTGSLFEIEAGVLTVVSTDGYRLAIIKEVINTSLENRSFVIPGSTLRELMKVIKDTDDELTITVSDRNVMFDFGEFKIVSRLLEGKYINYKPVILSPNGTYIMISAGELANSLERASLLINDDVTAKAEKLPVVLNIGQDMIEITCMTGKGKIYDVIDVNVMGEGLVIGFNHRLLLDAIRACDNEEIKIEFSNPKSACFIKSTADDSYMYMILPVRLYQNEN